MKNPTGVDSKEFGLAAGLVFARYFLKTDHLHYGYWPDDLPVDILNLRKAQEAYCDVLLSHIPDGVQSVLDVGCGTGALSRKMIDRGLEVESVSPSPFLTARAREMLGERGVLHENTFEDLTLGRKFDMVLFSESFQYVKLDRVFGKCRDLLEDGGHVLLCDFFKRDNPEGKSGLGGGHPLASFYRRLEDAGFFIILDTDLTARIAPSMDLVADFLESFGKPMWDLMLYALESNHPMLHRLARWKYRGKIDKIEKKYFSGRRNAVTFAADKSYRLVLCKPGELEVRP